MNVVEIISDQHQARCMGCEGHAQAITPNMDRLAREGVRFTHAYTQSPICTPSRVSVLSGQYCHNHGYYALGGPQPKTLPNFVGHFRQHGYRTAAIGKLHLPHDPTDWIFDDCDLWADCHRMPHQADRGSRRSAYADYLRELGLLDKEDSSVMRDCPPGWRQQQCYARPSLLPFEHCVEGWCVQRAIGFLETYRDQPFYMQVSLPRPHTAHTPDQQFWDMYDQDLELPETFYADPSGRPPHFQEMVRLMRRTSASRGESPEFVAKRVWRGYLACITHVDHAVGLLLENLDRLGLAEETIVIYHADHGAYHMSHGIQEKAPGISSELICRIPFLWRVPGVSRASHVCGELVENVDIAPTITSLCGLPPMTSYDGFDLSDLLRGNDRALRQVAVTEHQWSRALRFGPWRFVHYQPKMFNGRSIGELYNLQEDRDEATNLYYDPRHQDIVHQCRRLLLEWLIDTHRPVTSWHNQAMSRHAVVRPADDTPEALSVLYDSNLVHI